MSSRRIRPRKRNEPQSAVDESENSFSLLTNVNDDCFLHLLSYLNNEETLKLRLVSKSLKCRVDFCLPLIYKKITLTETSEGSTDLYSVGLVKKALVKSTRFSQATTVVVESPGVLFEPILCVLKRNLSPEKFKVCSNEEKHNVDTLLSLASYFPNLKKLCLAEISIHDDEMSQLFRSLTQLESFKAQKIDYNFEKQKKWLSNIGPNLTKIKWTDNTKNMWERDAYFAGKGRQLTSFTLRTWNRQNSRYFNLVEFLCREMPNLTYLHLKLEKVELHGLHSLSALKQVQLDIDEFESHWLCQPMPNVKILFVKTQQYTIRRVLRLFPSLEELIVKSDGYLYTERLAKINRTIQSLEHLRNFTVIFYDYFEFIPQFIETLETLTSPNLNFLDWRGIWSAEQFDEIANLCDNVNVENRKITLILGDENRPFVRQTPKLCVRFVPNALQEAKRIMRYKAY